MGLKPAEFWRLTLAEWRGMLGGYTDRIKVERTGQAWTVSHLLIAAGCDPESVTVAKLMGKKDRRSRWASSGSFRDPSEIWAAVKAQQEALADGEV